MCIRDRYCRSGQGPVIIEAKTYRYLGHSKSDECEYRCAEEVNRWKKKDPIIIFKNYLIENIDTIIAAEKPKLSPYINEMKMCIRDRCYKGHDR